MGKSIMKAYRKELKKAVWSLDTNKLDAFIEKWEKIGIYENEVVDMYKCAPDEVKKATIATMACNMTDTPKKVLEKARKILNELNMDECIG